MAGNINWFWGIRHDDYNYSEVNIMLSGEMKTFIKIISCFPEKTTASLRDSVMSEFKLSEKVTFNFLSSPYVFLI